MNTNIVVALVIICCLLPILSFFLGYYYSCTRIQNAAMRVKIKACELDLKLKEAHLKEMNARIDKILPGDNPDVEVFKIPLGDEKALTELLNKLENKEENNPDKKE